MPGSVHDHHRARDRRPLDRGRAPAGRGALWRGDRSRHRRRDAARGVREQRRRRPRRGGRDGRVRDLERAIARAPLERAVPLPRARRGARGRARPRDHRRARQDRRGRARGGPARPRGRRVRLRRRAPAQGRGVRGRRHRRRLALAAPAARRGGRHHAVQLPRDGPDVDVPARARVRERVHPEAEREGSLRLAADGRVARRGRASGRRLQRAARRPRDGRGAAAPPRRRFGLVRGIDAGREVHLRDGDGARQARPGARRRQEPRRRDARRRRRDRRRRDRLRRLRLGRPALHGDLRGRRGRRRRRRARRGARVARGRRHRRARRGGREPDGPARDRRGARPRAGGDRGRRGRGRRAAPRRARDLRARARGGLLDRADAVRPRHAGDVGLPRRDLRAGARAAAGGHVRGGARAGQLEPLRQRLGDLHGGRPHRARVRAARADRHGRRERPDPGADGVLLVRRLEAVAVRGPARARPRGRALLHARQGGHGALAADRQARGADYGFPAHR